MQIKLKPCPDCGGKVIVRDVERWDGWKEFVLQCTKCRGGLFQKKPNGTVGGWEYESDVAKVVDLFNLMAELKELSEIFGVSQKMEERK